MIDDIGALVIEFGSDKIEPIDAELLA
jgi:hypothetical protein